MTDKNFLDNTSLLASSVFGNTTVATPNLVLVEGKATLWHVQTFQNLWIKN